MKRQRIRQVFNSCRHSSTMHCVNEYKLFTVLFNRRAVLEIALLLSILLPLNHAAPTEKSLSYSNGIEMETTPNPPAPSSSSETPPPPPTPTITIEKVTFRLNGTFQPDKINDKVVSPPVDIALNVLSSTTVASAMATASVTIEKTPSNDKASSIEYNHNVSTIKIDSVRVTTSASSSNNYLDKNNDSASSINILMSESQTQPTAVDDKNINDDNVSPMDGSILPTQKVLSEHLHVALSNGPSIETTTTFASNQHNSPNGLSDSNRLERNKNKTQGTIFTTENAAQLWSSSSSSTISLDSMTDTSKASYDNVATSTVKAAFSSTDIDELSFRPNTEHYFNSPANVESEKSNLLSTATNDNFRDHDEVAATNDGKSKRFDATELGQNEKRNEETQIMIKSTSTTVTNSDIDPIQTTKTVGQIAKVFNEEKLSKKAKHESIGNNNTNYNNKNNKDKSKKKANDNDDDNDEEQGVNNPNGKVNDNLLMGSVSSTQEPMDASSSSLPSFGTDVRSTVVVQTKTTIPSMKSHFVDVNLLADKMYNAPIKTHTKSINIVDVTNFTPTSTIDKVHISSTLNVPGFPSTSTTIEPPTKTDFVQVENTIGKHDTVGEKITSTTLQPETVAAKEPINETTLSSENQLETDNATTPTEITGNNEPNKHANGDDNEMSQTDNNEFVRNEMKTTLKATARRPSILDYDKSSEEIFDIIRETPTTNTEILSTLAEKRQPNAANNDEFFLPADDLDTDTTLSSSVTTTSATEIIQSTIPANTESAIIRPNTDGLGPTINVPITVPIVTTDTKQQTIDTNKASTISRDSDTFFYISNTEVKVVESSMPTPNSKQENQFFPALFEEDVIIDFPGKNGTGWNGGLDGAGDKYEEDIILSPMKSNFDPTKFNDENLSVSYVGESFIDIKEATSDDTSSGSDSNAQNNDISSESKESSLSFADNGISSNVIIEPVVIPDIQQSIGVPIIGELPSQINIRDLDYKNDAIQLNNSGNSISAHFPIHADNLQKAQELTAELPKTDSEEVSSLIDEEKLGIGKNETQKTNTTTAAEAITNVTAASTLDDNFKISELN